MKKISPQLVFDVCMILLAILIIILSFILPSYKRSNASKEIKNIPTIIKSTDGDSAKGKGFYLQLHYVGEYATNLPGIPNCGTWELQNNMLTLKSITEADGTVRIYVARFNILKVDDGEIKVIERFGKQYQLENKE